ncbi:MAG TPA: hypothetical protein VGB55_01485 [Tepidisphaeraceae bacterium]
MDAAVPHTPAKRASSSSLNWLYPVALVLALAALAGGAYLAYRGITWSLAAAGVVSVLGVLIAWPIAAAFSGASRSMSGAMTPVYDRLEQFSVMLNEISEQQLLSDRAKAIAYREKDREAVRRAITEDISKRDWEAALVLVNSMDTEFGYKQESERIREDINQKFSDHIRRQIQAGIGLIDRHTANQQWASAFREADRLQQQFPTQEDVRSLPAEIEMRRQAYKQRLLNDYNDRIAAKDIDGAIVVVRKLDFYLTPDEGAGMSESVRNLFKDKLNLLKDQFTEAVHQSRWADAYHLGDVIVRDFPNTQMAREVRDKLDSLKRRADESSAVPTGV